MAVTATMEMAPGPSWDEKIVPTLRKRLETESKLLAKRMSAASINSEDNTPQLSPRNNSSHTATIQTYYHHQPRPSAIPRPSIQSRPSDSSNRPTQSQFTRTRTISQPFPFDADTVDRTAASPSPTSPPLSNISRIPIKARTGSVSTSTHSTPRIDGRISKDTYYAADAIAPRNKASALVNEQPPFPPDTDVDSVRFSSESEERPFEHWYRGDVSRNGGVGEFRVARRKEMLEIANYGHSTKKKLSSRAASRFGVHTEAASPRRRAGSIGVDRSSFYMEDPRSKDDLVLDEVPPSAIAYSDPEPEDDHDSEMDYYFGSHTTTASFPPASFEPEPQQITTVPEALAPSQKRPSREHAQTRSMTTPEPVRASSDSPSTSSSPPPRTPTPRTRSQTPTNSVGNQTPRQNSKSPGPDKSPRSNGTAKKAKTTLKTPPSAHKTKKGLESRRSVGVYPVTELDDAEHAIPTLTQPVEGSNWDEVVLPAVARKKGLDGQYQTTIGNTKPRKPDPHRPEPAPGTFGYDYSKYRPPRDGDSVPNGIELDDFGVRKPATDTDSTVEKLKEGPPSTAATMIEDDRPITTAKQNGYNHRPSPPPSPAPFSRYTPQSPLEAKPIPFQAPPPAEEEDHSGGCCKCVIM
ncbi:hypothetical protein BJ322DRAFT_1091334 [Thelephora terrestris]|uniref:Uncharacterized protein n=1 Tax=Thelephora terrestris TaxID=56493 RepID=A0A9P6H473_9AGAM|nr:hypothetical protein BJ322DRAFT_1091334 [Thelephora terrestris]